MKGVSFVLFAIVCAVLYFGLHVTTVAALMALLFLDSFWAFAVLFAFEAGFILWCLDNKDNDEAHIGYATVSVLAVLTFLQFSSSLRPFTYIIHNPAWSALYFAGYVGSGVVWSFAKWWFFVKGRARKYQAARAEFLRYHSVVGDQIPNNLLSRWKTQVDTRKVYQPEASNYKGTILAWMCYWPLSLVWTLINDPIKRLFLTLYENLQFGFDRISSRIYASMANDFRDPAPEDPNPADADDPRSSNRRRSEARF